VNSPDNGTRSRGRRRFNLLRAKLVTTVFGETTRAMLSREQSSPKTVLGFLGTVVIAVISGAALIVGVLARYDEHQELIPVVLIVAASIVVFVLLVILGIVVFGNPMKLQLGQVTASEYREYERMILGDSVEGVRVEIEPGGRQTPSESNDQPELPSGEGAT
jgi:hypothetical protein